MNPALPHQPWSTHLRSLAGAERAIRAASARTLACQLAVVTIAAPTGAEDARAAFVAASLRRAGVSDVTQDGAGNVIARLPAADGSTVAPVCVLAHLDTVFGDGTVLTVRHDGARVLCPGIGDNGRGLAALVTLAVELLSPEWRARQHRPIELVATVGEEGLGNLRGARHYFDALAARHIQPAAVVVLDGPGDAAIVHHAVASRRIRVEWRGPGGHSWSAANTPNPVHAAGAVIAAIARLSATAPRESSVAVTRTGGGESLTSIPQQAWIEVDMRALETGVLERLSASVHAVLRESARQAHPGHPVPEHSVHTLGDRPAGALSASHPLVTLAVEATEWTGVTPVAAMASTDANIALARGIPAIAIGAGGRGGGAHTTDEWYDDQDGARGIVRAFAIVTGWSHRP